MNENRPAKWLAGLATIVVALALQTTIFSKLPLPGHPPNLLLVLVVAVALAGGAGAGVWMGFLLGLAADLISNHPLGLLALVFLLVGAAVGQIESERERSVFASIVVVAIMAVGSFVLYLIVFALLPGQ
ncbi:MAG TPA: rod shape-determining protein MreD, partial [Mycobacteriales bacterium]|nr:rod shape-determining protein MreD [Mycobacteriales bacterium]